MDSAMFVARPWNSDVLATKSVAPEFDQDTTPAVRTKDDSPFAGFAARTLAGLRQSAFPQQLHRALDIAVGVRQRPFAIHHPSARRIPKRFHIFRRNTHSFFSPSALAAVVATWVSGPESAFLAASFLAAAGFAVAALRSAAAGAGEALFASSPLPPPDE